MDMQLVSQAVQFHGPDFVRNLTAELREQIFSSLPSDIEKHRRFHRSPEIGDEQFLCRMRQFIAKKADIIYQPVQNKPNTADEDFDDKYAILPALESFMGLEPEICKEHFFNSLEKKDVVVGVVTSLMESGLVVHILCLDNNKARAVDDINISAFCPVKELPRLVPGENATSGYHVKDIVRAAVLNVNQEMRRIVISLQDRMFSSEDAVVPKLGLISEDDFPVYYKRTLHVRGLPFEELLHSIVGFNNSGNVAYLINAHMLKEESSLMHRLHNLQIPEKEFAENLRKSQSQKMAHSSVAQGVLMFKKGKQLEAMQHLNRALQIDEKNVEALVARGALYANNESYSRAIDDFEEALSVNTQHVNARKYLYETLIVKGKADEECGDLEEAEESYRKAVVLFPVKTEAKEALRSLITKQLKKHSTDREDCDVRSPTPDSKHRSSRGSFKRKHSTGGYVSPAPKRRHRNSDSPSPHYKQNQQTPDQFSHGLDYRISHRKDKVKDQHWNTEAPRGKDQKDEGRDYSEKERRKSQTYGDWHSRKDYDRSPEDGTSPGYEKCKNYRSPPNRHWSERDRELMRRESFSKIRLSSRSPESSSSSRRVSGHDLSRKSDKSDFSKSPIDVEEYLYGDVKVKDNEEKLLREKSKSAGKKVKRSSVSEKDFSRDSFYSSPSTGKHGRRSLQSDLRGKNKKFYDSPERQTVVSEKSSSSSKYRSYCLEDDSETLSRFSKREQYLSPRERSSRMLKSETKQQSPEIEGPEIYDPSPKDERKIFLVANPFSAKNKAENVDRDLESPKDKYKHEKYQKSPRSGRKRTEKYDTSFYEKDKCDQKHRYDESPDSRRLKHEGRERQRESLHRERSSHYFDSDKDRYASESKTEEKKGEQDWNEPHRLKISSLGSRADASKSSVEDLSQSVMSIHQRQNYNTEKSQTVFSCRLEKKGYEQTGKKSCRQDEMDSQESDPELVLPLRAGLTIPSRWDSPQDVRIQNKLWSQRLACDDRPGETPDKGTGISWKERNTNEPGFKTSKRRRSSRSSTSSSSSSSGRSSSSSSSSSSSRTSRSGSQKKKIQESRDGLVSNRVRRQSSDEVRNINLPDIIQSASTAVSYKCDKENESRRGRTESQRRETGKSSQEQKMGSKTRSQSRSAERTPSRSRKRSRSRSKKRHGSRSKKTNQSMSRKKSKSRKRSQSKSKKRSRSRSKKRSQNRSRKRNRSESRSRKKHSSRSAKRNKSRSIEKSTSSQSKDRSKSRTEAVGSAGSPADSGVKTRQSRRDSHQSEKDRRLSSSFAHSPGSAKKKNQTSDADKDKNTKSSGENVDKDTDSAIKASLDEYEQFLSTLKQNKKQQWIAEGKLKLS